MYKLKSYYNTTCNIETPDCMYKLEVIKDDLSYSTEMNSFPEVGRVDVSVLASLEDRQEAILSKLQELKSQVDKIAQTQKSTVKPDDNVKGEALRDLVVSANPANPPASLLVLQKLLAKQYKVYTACHCHSSVTNVSENLKNVFDSKADTMNRTQYEIAFTLVWKAVKHGPTLMVSPRSQVLLEGEGTAARYLARLLQPSYDDCDSVLSTDIDQWVDCAMQFTKGNNKEKNSILKNINSKLGKSDWLVGNEMSLADIMIWSVVVGKEVAPNTKTWLDKLNALPEFKTIINQLNIVG